MNHQDYFETNRSLWNGWTRLHVDSAFYDLPGFKAGNSTLMSIERQELSDVQGKSLLHLQCHFGLDTLSWAREGARVTGVDFSDEAISTARSLGRELGIPATFIQSNLFDLPDVLDDRFDVVFTSYGVLEWLPDLERWAGIVARYLKPGGTFYMVEFHPLMRMLDDETGRRLEYDYFFDPNPERYEEHGTYADAGADFSHTSFAWTHGLGEIVTSLLSAGLQLEYLHEFPYSVYNTWDLFEENEPGRFTLKGSKIRMPLMFSIRTHRPA